MPSIPFRYGVMIMEVRTLVVKTTLRLQEQTLTLVLGKLRTLVGLFRVQESIS